MKELPFSIVPVEAAMDDRLSKGELRVLIALLSFRNRNTNLCCPKRESIIQRTGYSKSMVSRMTTKLCEHGWLEKSGDGRFGKSNHYVITVPEVATAAIVAATAPLMVAATAPPIVAATAPLKEQTIKQTKLTDKSIGQNEFDRWWLQYPNKVKKKEALKVWDRIKPDADLLTADIINRVENDTAYQGDKRYIPHPTSYLNGERWNDELQKAHGTSQQSVQDEYAARKQRTARYIQEIDDSHVGVNGTALPPPMD